MTLAGQQGGGSGSDGGGHRRRGRRKEGRKEVRNKQERTPLTYSNAGGDELKQEIKGKGEHTHLRPHGCALHSIKHSLQRIASARRLAPTTTTTTTMASFGSSHLNIIIIFTADTLFMIGSLSLSHSHPKANYLETLCSQVEQVVLTSVCTQRDRVTRISSTPRHSHTNIDKSSWSPRCEGVDVLQAMMLTFSVRPTQHVFTPSNVCLFVHVLDREYY